jgi:hypothetical protein
MTSARTSAIAASELAPVGSARTNPNQEGNMSSTTGKTDQATPRTCGCGCGATTKSKFAIGHDARFASSLRRQFEAGTLTRAQAQKQADQVSPAFSRKVRRSLELAAERMAEAKAAAKAPKPAPAVKAASKPASRARATKAPKPQVTAKTEPPADDQPASDAA